MTFISILVKVTLVLGAAAAIQLALGGRVSAATRHLGVDTRDRGRAAAAATRPQPSRLEPRRNVRNRLDVFRSSERDRWSLRRSTYRAPSRACGAASSGRRSSRRSRVRRASSGAGLHAGPQGGARGGGDDGETAGAGGPHARRDGCSAFRTTPSSAVLTGCASIGTTSRRGRTVSGPVRR